MIHVSDISPQLQLRPPASIINPSPRSHTLPHPVANPHPSSNISLPHTRIPSHPKSPQPVNRQRAQPRRQWLPRAQSARDRASGQDDRRQKRQLHSVRLAVLDAVAAEGVL